MPDIDKISVETTVADVRTARDDDKAYEIELELRLEQQNSGYSIVEALRSRRTVPPARGAANNFSVEVSTTSGVDNITVTRTLFTDLTEFSVIVGLTGPDGAARTVLKEHSITPPGRAGNLQDPCGAANGFQIEFPRSGIIVEPFEIDYRSETQRYSYCSCRLSEVAGKVAEKRNKRAPALLRLDGETAGRFFVPEDAVSFTSDLDNNTVADIRLLDARKVLADAAFDKTYSRFTFRDVIEDILAASTDPNGVITDYQILDQELAQKSRSAFFAPLDFGTGTNEVDDGLVSQPRHALGYIIDNLPFLYDPNTPLSFEDTTPLAALNKLMRRYSFDSWIDNDGILYLGLEGTKSAIVGITPQGSDIRLQEYSVTKSSNITDTVNIRGGYQTEDGIIVIAEATTSDFEGSAIYPETNTTVSEPERLEKIATRQLFRESMADVSGSCVINGLASSDSEALATLERGSYFLVDGLVSDHCAEDVLTGTFIVSRVHHRIGNGIGWEIDIDVSRVPSGDSISTKSVYYDPLSDKKYDNFKALKRQRSSLTEDLFDNAGVDL